MAWRTWGLALCVAAAAIGYHMPWVAHDTAGFTMNGFDLAEWSSLHPAVRSASMQTSLMLRAPLLALVVMLALIANGAEDMRWRWILRLGALLLALRLVPPKEFFDGATDDPNYRQMGWMTGVGLLAVGVAVMIARVPRGWHAVGIAAAGLAGVLAAWDGLSRANLLLDNFQIETAVGGGIMLYTVAVLMALVLAAWPAVHRFRLRQARRQTAATPV